MCASIYLIKVIILSEMSISHLIFISETLEMSSKDYKDLQDSTF